MAAYGVRIVLAATSPVPNYSGGMWVLGTAQLSASSGDVGWAPGRLIEVSHIGEQVDIAGGGNYAEISDFECVIDANGWPAFVAAGASMQGAAIDVGTLIGGVFDTRWRGLVVAPEWRGAEIRISAESTAANRHRAIPFNTIDPDYVDTYITRKNILTSIIPISYGSNDRQGSTQVGSERVYSPCFYGTQSSTSYVERTSTYCGAYGGGTILNIARNNYSTVYSFTLPHTYWLNRYIAGEQFFIEIHSGAGSGQIREITAVGDAYIHADTNMWRVPITIDYSFTTSPDATSTIKLFTNDARTTLLVADEAIVSSIVSDVNGFESEISASTRFGGGAVFADISGEFIEADKYKAFKFYSPSNNYGHVSLSDQASTTGTNYRVFPEVRVEWGSGEGEFVYVADMICQCDISVFDIPDETLEKITSITVVPSFMCDADIARKYTARIFGVDYSGAKTLLGSSGQILNYDDSINAFSPSILLDGQIGNFPRWSIDIDTSDAPLMVFHHLWVFLSVTRWDNDYYSEHAMSQTEYINGSTQFYTHEDKAPGYYIRPIFRSVGGVPVDPLEWNSERSSAASYWRLITNVEDVSYDDVFLYKITVASGWDIPTSLYWTFRMESDGLFQTINEREIGIGAVYGEIGIGAKFSAYTSSGRNYHAANWATLPAGDHDGERIEFAPRAALDIMYRDLGISASVVDQTAFLALQNDEIHAVLSTPEDSASILARMCREFNWIAAHDKAGRETARRWLDRVGTTGFDFAVGNADIITDTFDGEKMSAVEDQIVMPSISWRWTGTDGFRSVASVISLDIAPASLDSANYTTYLTGFSDFTQASEVYSIAHAARAKYGTKPDGAIEYRYASNPAAIPSDDSAPQALLLDSGFLAWVAARKRIFEFAILESHAAAIAVCGDRIKITHRRYAPAPVYGTLVAHYWTPASGRVQLTIMIDP